MSLAPWALYSAMVCSISLITLLLKPPHRLLLLVNTTSATRFTSAWGTLRGVRTSGMAARNDFKMCSRLFS